MNSKTLFTTYYQIQSDELIKIFDKLYPTKYSAQLFIETRPTVQLCQAPSIK